MFTRLLLLAAYLFLLAVLLPHTAWMFAQFEPEQSRDLLGWAGAIAFEITIAALTHFLAKELAAVSDIAGENFWQRVKRELVNIPSFLLLSSIIISTVANWTHAYTFANADSAFGTNMIIKIVYSILFGAALPLCSFAYAYVLSKAYRQDKTVGAEGKIWQTLIDYRNTNPGQLVTPRQLATMSGTSEEIAAQVLTAAVNAGAINNGKV